MAKTILKQDIAGTQQLKTLLTERKKRSTVGSRYTGSATCQTSSTGGQYQRIIFYNIHVMFFFLQLNRLLIFDLLYIYFI